MVTIGKIYNALMSMLGAISGVFIVVIAIGVFFDVTLRWTLGKPIGWMLELSEYSLVCITFLGMPWLAKQKGHILVDILIEILPEKISLGLYRFVTFISVVLCIYFCYWASVAAVNDFTLGIKTFGAYSVPRFIVISIAMVGILLTGVEFFRQLILSFNLKEGLQEDIDIVEKFKHKDPL